MKKIILGLVVGMLIGSATTALAAPDTVQAVIGKFKIVVNGKEQQLDNALLVVKGTTYLPFREVAGLLSHDVKFEGSTGTINLDAKASSEIEQNNDDRDVNNVISEISISDWTLISHLEREHDVVRTVGLPSGQDQSSDTRELTVQFGNKSESFIIPKLMAGDLLIKNSNGEELLYKDGYEYLKNEFVERLLNQ